MKSRPSFRDLDDDGDGDGAAPADSSKSKQDAPSLDLLAVVERAEAHALVTALPQHLPMRLQCVRHAAIAPEAVAAAQVVVIECRLLEGFADLAFVRRIRAERPLMPIVAVSVNQDPGFVQQAFAAGVTDFLRPDQLPELVAAKLLALEAMGRAARLAEVQNGELVRSLSVLRVEMQERLKAEQEKALAQEQSQQAAKLASLGEMAGSIAHEIKTPLAVITGVLSVLRSELEAPNPELSGLLESVQDMEKMSDRIAAIIRGLKSYSRHDEVDPYEPTDLDGIIADTMALCDEVIERTGIKLSIPRVPGLMLECQPTQISQILLNLITNARHAVEALPAPWITLEVHERGDWLEIVVADSGGGIPPHLREKIFQPFFTTKARGVGTGLGLSVSHKIAVAHGGSLKLDGDAPTTRFVLVLPRRQATIAAQARPKAS
jgi:signal transduction histidine kinase